MNLMPGSPSYVSAMSPFLYTPPTSPSNDILHSSMAWPQQSFRTLHLSVNNIQASRLRSSFNARDIPSEELNMLQDFEMQQRLIAELSSPYKPQFGTSSANLSAGSSILIPTKLDHFPYAEISSPRCSDHFAASTVLYPSHKSVVLNQLQLQENMLSPIKTNVFPPKNFDHTLLQASFGISSPRRISPWKVEIISPMSSRLSALAQREKLLQQFCNPSCDLKSDSVIGSPVNSWSKLESPSQKVDLSVQVGELNCLCKFYSLGFNGEALDVSSVQSFARETTTVPHSRMPFSAEGSNLNPQSEPSDQLGGWLDQLQHDQIVA